MGRVAGEKIGGAGVGQCCCRRRLVGVVEFEAFPKPAPLVRGREWGIGSLRGGWNSQ